jgi:hypothetical protein
MPKKLAEPHKPIDFTFDIYVSSNGKNAFILAI